MVGKFVLVEARACAQRARLVGTSWARAGRRRWAPSVSAISVVGKFVLLGC